MSTKKQITINFSVNYDSDTDQEDNIYDELYTLIEDKFPDLLMEKFDLYTTSHGTVQIEIK